MREYTTISLMNTPMAKRYIADHAEECVEGAAFWNRCGAKNTPDGLYRKDTLDTIIAIFMAKYPRGKGTKGSEALRTFYAACYTIQAERSRNWRQKSRVEVKSDTECTILLAFVPAERIDNPKFPAKTLQALEDRDLITGTYLEMSRGFKPLQLWLTDRGIEAQRVARAMQRRKRADQYQAGYVLKDDGADYWTADINIGEHYGAVQIHRATEEEATTMRDKILLALKSDPL